jgi:hypothetical protein
MTDAADSQEYRRKARSDRPGINLWVWIGPLVVFTGAVTYFVFFAYFPTLRDFPWVNLPIVALGLVASAQGLRRAFVDARHSVFARMFAGVGFLLSLAITALFSAYIFFLSYQLPETVDVVQVAQAVPDFALPDQHRQTVQLSNLLGRKIVLDFYRGHW